MTREKEIWGVAESYFVQPGGDWGRTSWQLLHDGEGREGGADTSNDTRKCLKAASKDAQIGY